MYSKRLLYLNDGFIKTFFYNKCFIRILVNGLLYIINVHSRQKYQSRRHFSYDKNPSKTSISRSKAFKKYFSLVKKVIFSQLHTFVKPISCKHLNKMYYIRQFD